MANKILKNASFFIDGVGFAGEFESFKIPTIELPTETIGGKTVMMPIVEPLEYEETLHGFLTDTIRSLGADKQIIIKASLINNDETVTPATVTMQGFFNSMEPAAFTPGEKSTVAMKAKIHYLKLDINGTKEIEISTDQSNPILVLGGVDKIASERAAIGI